MKSRRFQAFAIVSLGLLWVRPPASAMPPAAAKSAPETAPDTSDGPEPLPSDPPTAPARGASDRISSVNTQPDSITLADGKVLEGRVTVLAEGDYCSFETEGKTQTFAWRELKQIELSRGSDAPSFVLTVRGEDFRPPSPATPNAPFIEIHTRNGKPASLFRLRDSADPEDKRYSTGYDEVCRAPCLRNIELGSGRFFINSHPWTTSKVVQISPGSERVKLLVRTGNVRQRKAGVGLMIAGAIGIPLATVLMSLPGTPKAVTDIGIGLISLSIPAVPVGGILFGTSRAKLEIAGAVRKGKKKRRRASR